MPKNNQRIFVVLNFFSLHVINLVIMFWQGLSDLLYGKKFDIQRMFFEILHIILFYYIVSFEFIN
jgi:hypothetical protein